jgi:hypothetical protein
MERPAPKTGPPPPPEPEPEPPAAQQPAASPWRVVLFIWVTAFGFLAAYELLWTIFKLLKLR